MKLFNRILFVFIIIGAMVFSGWIFFHDYALVQKDKVVLAEDEEDEGDEEDEEDEDERDDEEEIKKTEYRTEYVKLSDTVSTKTTTVTKYDSDGDGVLDDKDAHPTINENFVVKDGNLNGIDDRYEQ